MKSSHRALGMLIQQQHHGIHRDYVVHLQEGEKFLPNTGMLCCVIIVKIVQAQLCQTGAQSVNCLRVAKGNFMQCEIQCQWTHMVLFLISVQSSLDPELEGIIFNGIEDHFHRPHEILIPGEIPQVEREVGARLDDLHRSGMHPVDKKVSHIANISGFAAGSKYVNSEHVM